MRRRTPSARPDPIAIVGDLERRHAGADADAVAILEFRIGTGDRIELVVAEDVVDGVIDVETADVAESRLAEVGGAISCGVKSPTGAGRTRMPLRS